MIVPGDSAQGGWRPLVQAPTPSAHGFEATGPVSPIATFLVSSDWHICDHTSPARLEYLDRFFDPDNADRSRVGPVGTYRPQEFLTRQVGEAFVRTANAVVSGPRFGDAIDAMVITGDVIDNGQLNELGDYVALLSGGTVTPANPSDWVGSPEARFNEHFWHPEPAPRQPKDRPSRLFGYPAVPGILDAAAATFQATGLRHPWLTVHGNHDALLQGTVTPTSDLHSLATGSRRIRALPEGASWADIMPALRRVGPARYVHDDSFPHDIVTPDATRAFLGPKHFKEAMAAAPGLTVGHGFTEDSSPVDGNYFATEINQVVLIGLDTVNPHGGYEGSLDELQVGWLESQLVRYADRLVIVASHHPPAVLTNDYAPEGANRRVLGDEVLRLLHKAGNVITWLTGHEHRHAFSLHISSEGHLLPEISTASLIDWPQQGRVLEWGIDSRGNIAISSSALDHSGTVIPDQAHDRIDYLASWSRLLSANDYQRREPYLSLERSAGFISDRYFNFILPNPFEKS